MRHLPHRPLPDRAYIPGQGDRPAESEQATAMSRPGDAFMLCDDYLYGVDLFNTGFVWEAHESWERVWKVAEAGAARELLHGLIQCAAAAVKVAQNNAAGLRSVSQRALGHLSAAESSSMGLDVPTFASNFRQWAAGAPASLDSMPAIELRIRSRDRAGTLTDGYVDPRSVQGVGRDEYLVRRTPSRGDYHSGQQVIPDDPPTPGNAERWFETFRRELSDVGYARQRVAWETGSADRWAGAGPAESETTYEQTLVMRVDTWPRQPPLPVGIEVRELVTDADWSAAVDLSVALHAPTYGESYESFARWRYVEYRASLDAAGTGAFWGAFDGGRLTGSLGLLSAPTWMRFQSVMTALDDRRRGVCTSLVSWALHEGFAMHPGAIAIVAVKPGSAAEQIYRRAGFRVIGSQHALSRAGAHVP